MAHFVLASWLVVSLSAALKPGDAMPDLSEFTLEGELPDLKGKVVLLDVWASWCGPCKASFPAFDAMHDAKVDDGLVILAVSVDKKSKDYESFLKRLQPRFATVRDANQELVALLGPPTMPTSYIFGRDGRLRTVHRGFKGDRTVEELASEIETLLQEIN